MPPEKLFPLRLRAGSHALHWRDALPTVDWAEMGVPRPPQPVLRDGRRAERDPSGEVRDRGPVPAA